jgi:hypothetical protein
MAATATTPPVHVIRATDALQVLPIALDQRRSSSGMLTVATFIAISAAVLLAPFGFLAAEAAANPAQFLTAIGNPATALQLGLALVVGIAFVALPLQRLRRRARQPEQIMICDQQVSATHGTSAGTWCEPLTAYQGIAHHIRTSLSGAQHEIVLVHTDPSRSVVLQIADRIAQPQLDAMAALLNVAQVPARTIYERHRPARSTSHEAPVLRAA